MSALFLYEWDFSDLMAFSKHSCFNVSFKKLFKNNNLWVFYLIVKKQKTPDWIQVLQESIVGDFCIINEIIKICCTSCILIF